jgi:hypothetical protein
LHNSKGAVDFYPQRLFFCPKEDFMKRFLVFFLVLVLGAGFAAAQDVGLTVGLEFGLENVGKAYDGDVAPYLMPMLIYENAFLDDALDLYAELDYTLGFTKVPNEDGDEVLPQSLYIDLSAGYNLSLGDASTLSIILENEFADIDISPDDFITGIFTPAIKFNQGFDFGDVYAQVGLPITYFPNVKDAEAWTGLDFTIGWGSSFGLGIEVIIYTMLVPDDDAGYSGLEATISYEADSLYCELNAAFPSESAYGITITPEVDYSFGSITAYLSIEFDGIGSEGGQVIITPALGIKYSF